MSRLLSRIIIDLKRKKFEACLNTFLVAVFGVTQDYTKAGFVHIH